MQMKLETSYGIIKYEERKCSLEIDRDFLNYYYSLIPKYIKVNKPKYNPHITIVRTKYEEIQQNYGLWDGMRIPFLYLPLMRQDKLYFWLDCFSLHIGLLRGHLGLSWFRNNFNSYHCTIANFKEHR